MHIDQAKARPCAILQSHLMERMCAVLVLLAMLNGCGQGEPRVYAADVHGSAALGEDGPFAVWQGSQWLGPDVFSMVDTELYLPIVATGNIGPRPAVVLVQGGFVTVERYRWLSRHIASRGFVVLAPRHPLDLAFFAQDNARNALAGALLASQSGDAILAGRIMDAPALVLGHSLGGVVAAKAWLRGGPKLFAHLLLLASEPDPADDFSTRTTGRVLSLTGRQDGKISPAEVAAGAQAFAQAQVAVIDGMNHYQFTDDASESELRGDGIASVSTEAARHAVLVFVDALLATLSGHSAYILEDPLDWPEGVHVPEAQ